MSLTGRLSRGVALTRASVGVVRREPSLAIFPLLSALVVLFVLVVVGAVGGVFTLGAGVALGDLGESVVVPVALFAVYFVGTVVATFFNAALVHNAVAVLRGEDPSLREGLAAAWGVKGRIAAWGLVAATVGVILNWIEEEGGAVGRMLAGLFEFGWALATFFVVPVLVFEEGSIRDALTRSGGLFRDTWGESATASVGVGLVAVLAALVGLVGLVAALVLATSLALVWIALFVLYLIAVALFASALSGVARAALYLYAVEGRVGFDGVDPAAVFGESGGRSRSEPGRTI